LIDRLAVALPIPRRGAWTTQIRRTWLQYSLRIHRRRPTYMYQPTQDVPWRVPGNSLQGLSSGHAPKISSIMCWFCEWLN